MKALLIGDIHLADKPPSSCTPSYLDDLFVMLDECGELAEEHDVDAVVLAGDVFHVKAPTRTSHSTVQRAISLLQSFERATPPFIVPGNHDVQNDRMDSLRRQPLGVIFESGAAVKLDGRAGILPLIGVPWPLDYHNETELAARLEPAGPDDLVVAHYPLYPPGLELEWEHFPMKRWADLQGNAGFCYYGHVHERHGIHTVNGVTFCNAGAITRGSLHESELTRMPAVTIWEQGTGFTEIPLATAKPPSEVFRLLEHEEAKTAEARFEEFLTSVTATRLEHLSLESVLAHVRSQDLDPGVVAVITKLLEEVQAA